MSLDRNQLIGKTAILLLLQDNYKIPESLQKRGWKYCKGKVGSMDTQTVIAAVETAAKKQKINTT